MTGSMWMLLPISGVNLSIYTSLSTTQNWYGICAHTARASYEYNRTISSDKNFGKFYKLLVFCIENWWMSHGIWNIAKKWSWLGTLHCGHIFRAIFVVKEISYLSLFHRAYCSAIFSIMCTKKHKAAQHNTRCIIISASHIIWHHRSNVRPERWWFRIRPGN